MLFQPRDQVNFSGILLHGKRFCSAIFLDQMELDTLPWIQEAIQFRFDLVNIIMANLPNSSQMK